MSFSGLDLKPIPFVTSSIWLLIILKLSCGGKEIGEDDISGLGWEEVIKGLEIGLEVWGGKEAEGFENVDVEKDVGVEKDDGVTVLRAEVLEELLGLNIGMKCGCC